MTQFIPKGEEPARKKPISPIASKSAEEAVQRAFEFFSATTPAEHAKIARYFGKNPDHAHIFMKAKKLPDGMPLAEKKSLLWQQLGYRR